MNEKLLTTAEVAEKLGMSAQLVLQAKTESSTSFRPLFPKPYKRIRKYQQGASTGSYISLLWREQDILDYIALCARNPLAKLTRVRYEKAKKREAMGDMADSFRGVFSPGYAKHRKRMGKEALMKALSYASKGEIKLWLDEMDFNNFGGKMDLLFCPVCGSVLKDWRDFGEKSEVDRKTPFECTGFRCGKRWEIREILQNVETENKE